MSYFLSTGNLKSPSGLDLMQTTGFVIIAEKLNYLRYISHFRCIHRGQFFSELKTTSVRKLLPEAWGFLCPVHTPDGAPCGLLNHLSSTCKVVCERVETDALLLRLSSLGMLPLISGGSLKVLNVLLNGRVVGVLPLHVAEEFTRKLRYLKIMKDPSVPSILEIALVTPVSKKERPGQYPGLYLFTTMARMMRPVQDLATKQTELIGSFEQV
jgi:DNA-directed RNA polymerase I subunit RPA2